jgi:hypothetical protein
MKDPQQTEVIASLEGMKVVVRSGRCELHEYNFEVNTWSLVESSSYPLSTADSARWLTGWNKIDGQEARYLLLGSAGPA